MRFFLPTAAAIVAAASLTPAHAQQRQTRGDLGFSFVMPRGYSFAPDEQTYIADSKLLLYGPRNAIRTMSETNEGFMTAYGITNIRVSIRSKTSSTTGLNEELDFRGMNNEAARAFGKAFVETINRRSPLRNAAPLAYQNAAAIKIDKLDAVAILVNVNSINLDVYATVRIIVVPFNGDTYIFQFATINSEYEENVPAFESFMKSVRFIGNTAGKSAPPAPKKPKKKGG